MKTVRDIHFQGDFHHLKIADNSTLEVGTDVVFCSFASVEVVDGATLKLGNRVFFNDHCTIRCHQKIEIGKDTMFGDGVRIFDHNHKYSNYHVEKIDFTSEPITIGKNCWIGANVVILKGVTIGDNVIVGAGSLIYKDIPSNSIVTTKEELLIRERPQHAYQAFTLTASDTLENLTELVEALPEVNFNIAAKTSISPYLESFNKYNNVTLWTNIHHDDIIDDLLERSDIYLDINHWEEVDNILYHVFEKEKEVLSFETVCHRRDMMKDGNVFSSPEEMVSRIKDIIKELRNL